MGSRTYGCWDLIVSDSKIKEYAPVSYSRLYSFLEDHDMDSMALWQATTDGFDSGDIYELGDKTEDELESEFYQLIEDFVSEVYAMTGITIFPTYVDNEADSEYAGYTKWAAPLLLDPRVEKLGAKMVVWTEFG